MIWDLSVECDGSGGENWSECTFHHQGKVVMLLLPTLATNHMCGIPMTCNLSLIWNIIGLMMGRKKNTGSV